MPTAEINGIETYYERHGEGRPVVFVHGLTLDQRTWRPQIEPLAEDYEVITYDYRGHGETEGEDVSAIAVRTLVDDLRTLLDELALGEPVILCGHSYGGLVVSEYARRYSDDVAGVVFAEARTDIGQMTHERFYIRIQPLLGVLASVLGERRLDSVREFVVKTLENAERGDQPHVNELGMTPLEYVDDASETVSRGTKTAFLRAGLEFDGWTPAEFDGPVLYSYGELGIDTIGETAERLEQEENVRVREIPNADHLISLQNPTEFNRVLREFLADVPRDPGASDALRD